MNKSQNYSSNFFKITKTILWVVFLIAGTLLNAQNLSSNLPFNSKIKTGQLDNGLKYFIIQNKKPENKIELRLAINAGSILEDDDQQGLAHFMEHMNFNGLKHFPHNDVVHYLQSIGVGFGADLNAYTSFDETVYILPIPADNKGQIDSGFTILADWSANALLDSGEIDSERGVVLEESRLGKGADDRMFKKWFPRYLNGSHYAERIPIGKDEIIRNSRYDVVKRFHHDWYRPDLECVIVAGNIDPVEAERLIKQKFSGFKNPANERSRPESFDVPPRNSNDVMVLNDPEASYTQVMIIGSSYKGKKEITNNDYRDNLLENLFNGMMNERYNELKNSANPPFVYGGAEIGGDFVRGWKQFEAFAVCGNENMQEATTALVHEAMRIKKFGFTEAELKRAKESLSAGYEHLYNEREKTESRNLAGELIRHFLQNEPVPGIEWEYNFTKEQLPGISLNEVNNLAKKIDIDNKFFALITGKTSDKAPVDSDLKNWVNTALTGNVTAYEEKTIPSNLLDKQPVNGKITKTEKNKKLGTITYTLSNGALVTIKPTDFKDDQIICKASRFGGSSLYEGKDYQSADYSNNVVDEMGYGNFSNTDLEKFLSGKVVHLSIGIDKYTEDINGSTDKKDLETMFQLLYLKCTSPRIDEVAFKSYVNREKQQAENSKLNPQSLFIDSSQYILYNKNPRAHIIPVVSDFDKIEMAHAVQFYKDRMSSANGIHYFFVGSFEEKEMKSLIEKYIGGLPSNKINANYRDLNIDPIQGKNSFTLRMGKEQKSMIRDVLYGQMPYDINNELLTGLLSDVVNNKIIDTLREKMSGIYGGGIRLSISKYPKETYMMSSHLPCGPENVDKLETAFWKLIESAKKPDGITNEDLKKVTETALQKYKVSIKTNEYWLGILSRYALLGNDPERILTYEARVNAVTPQKLTEIANKYLNTDNVYKSLWLPEADK